MSTTCDLSVAVRYSLSAHATLLCIKTNSFIERGANISYLSAFAQEKEFLYPPLTFLEPTGKIEVVEFNARDLLDECGDGVSSKEHEAIDYRFTVIEMVPHMGS
mmetsp:Transcript_45769/g.91313  ORF Transcript_45769/g.91313 Transcript_45769/m.91313 type:complete len:104 (-) Transcript_45769:141-452(-)